MNLRFFGENHKNLLTFTKTSAEKLYKNRAVEIGYFSQLCFLCIITFEKVNPIQTAPGR